MKRTLAWLVMLAALGHVLAAEGQGGKVKIEVDTKKGLFEFYIGDELVTRYLTAGQSKPIFWPLNAPGGIPLTRNYPPPEGQAKDHPHQKSAWFCYGDVIPED